MQAEVEEAKRSLYRAQQKLLAQAQAAEARERQRAAELAADEAARRAQSAQEAAAMRARRQEMEQTTRKACVLTLSISTLSCTLHRESPVAAGLSSWLLFKVYGRQVSWQVLA